MLSPHCTLSVILVKRVSKEPVSHVIPKCTLRGGLSHFPPEFKNIFVVVITSPPILLCK